MSVTNELVAKAKIWYDRGEVAEALEEYDNFIANMHVELGRLHERADRCRRNGDKEYLASALRTIMLRQQDLKFWQDAKAIVAAAAAHWELVEINAHFTYPKRFTMWEEK